MSKKGITKEEAEATKSTLEKLDAMMGAFYEDKIAPNPNHKVPGGESTVAEMVNELAAQVPGRCIVANGHGYRMMTTLAINMMMQIDQSELAQSFLEAKQNED